MKKVGKVLLIVAGSLIGLIVLFFGSVYVVNCISEARESKKIEPYGKLMEVGEKKMNVEITGTGSETVVLLPGFLTGSPVIDFTQLTTELAKKYQVVVIEPFGYGLSESTEKERTLEAISTEIHQVLGKLKINRYTLMGHSISGIYTLDYINRYPDEVAAFVGIDSSVPNQPGGEDNQGDSLKLLGDSGLYRLLTKVTPEMIAYPEVDAHLKEQFRMISLKNMGNSSNVSESKNMKANFEAAKRLSYPTDFPVLFILAKASENDTVGWISLHEEMLSGLTEGKMVVLEGEHYLHHTKSPEIAKLYEEFMTSQSTDELE